MLARMCRRERLTGPMQVPALPMLSHGRATALGGNGARLLGWRQCQISCLCHAACPDAINCVLAICTGQAKRARDAAASTWRLRQIPSWDHTDTSCNDCASPRSVLERLLVSRQKTCFDSAGCAGDDRTSTSPDGLHRFLARQAFQHVRADDR